MRLVLDTNVLIAAYVARGICHDLLEHCKREHDLVTSGFVLDELENKLIVKLKVPEADAREARALAQSGMEVISPPALDAQVCRDPDDDWVLATAVAGRCRCFVTGDRDLRVLKEFRGIGILTPAEFWRYQASR